MKTKVFLILALSICSFDHKLQGPPSTRMSFMEYAKGRNLTLKGNMQERYQELITKRNKRLERLKAQYKGNKASSKGNA